LAAITIQAQPAPVKDPSPKQATLDIGTFAGGGFPKSSAFGLSELRSSLTWREIAPGHWERGV
jgi:hypothetical protein